MSWEGTAKNKAILGRTENNQSNANPNTENNYKIMNMLWLEHVAGNGQGWAKLVLIALERYSVELKRLTFNFR